MIEDKYYTSEIEDIRVGYEYETEEDPIRGIWEKVVIKNLYDLEDFCKYNKKDNDAAIRTPYLTEQQIEAEGWKHERLNLYMKSVENNKYSLHILDNHEALINRETNFHTLYKGRIPSINELRTISKLLNI